MVGSPPILGAVTDPDAVGRPLAALGAGARTAAGPVCPPTGGGGETSVDFLAVMLLKPKVFRPFFWKWSATWCLVTD